MGGCKKLVMQSVSRSDKNSGSYSFKKWVVSILAPLLVPDLFFVEFGEQFNIFHSYCMIFVTAS